MTCEKERARVAELQSQHDEAQEGCNSGIHGQCALAQGLLKELSRARTALQLCLDPAVPPAARPMTTDVRLDQVDGTFLELEARVVKAIASDFMLDQPSRRKGGAPHRRALVHNQSDGLTVNFNNDYEGGVTINGELTIRDGEPIRGGITVNGPITLDGGITMSRNLSLTGDIQFQIQHFNEIGDILSVPPPTETVSLAETIKSLRGDISALQNRIATLEAKP